MIRPVNITPLNTSKELRYGCEQCGAFGTITLKDSIVNTDYDGSPIEPLEYECPRCENKL